MLKTSGTSHCRKRSFARYRSNGHNEQTKDEQLWFVRQYCWFLDIIPVFPSMYKITSNWIFALHMTSKLLFSKQALAGARSAERSTNRWSGQLQTKENKTNSLMTKAHVKIRNHLLQKHVTASISSKLGSRKVGCSSDSIPTLHAEYTYRRIILLA